ncbi:class I tRNA ligase family protein [Venenivibrio stagnispumantis]|uniref:leucine--tRNA ligase n=1 Tax=Venenivibrio stagnispumantis TaxID=407998 RepID=A0AA46AEL8_9AQUI|nr:class I tRNA ligase family protein [Venenivibrio stagnispumantis]MCW4572822.1 class I tRNA ligase family protein [Venenivibrio stagnispumantis]SMP13539.1 leucyl-tRNA synthetase [Venenivibrio stagnispumantis]
MKLKEFLEKNHLTLNDNAKLLFEKLNLDIQILSKLEEKYGKSDKMSKSKHNTVDPDEMISKYGADTVRLYILFAAPPENNFDWIESGIEGAHRFLKRVWNFITENLDLIKSEEKKELNEEDLAIRRKLHQTIKKVRSDIEKNLQFNTAIASIMELMNAISDYKSKNPVILKEVAENLILMLSPFTPFIADYLWRLIGKEGYTINYLFPIADEEAIKETEKEIPVQINGKVRTTIKVKVDMPEEEIKKLALENVQKWIEGKEIVKIIFAGGKIINIVVK